MSTRRLPDLREAALAACLEQEWSGVLFPDECLDPVDGLAAHGPGAPPFLPTDFHGLVAAWLLEQVGSTDCIDTVREVGGGTGAFAREFLSRHPARTFGMVETSREKIPFARRLLLGDGSPGGIPVINADFSITHRPIPENYSFIDGRDCDLEIIEGDGSRMGGTVDLMVCLNVVDRVPDPAAFTAALARQVRPGGWMLLADPLDWLGSITPEKNRVATLEELVPVDWEIVARRDFLFPFRSHPRRIVLFLTEAMVLRRP
ncbi:MAG: class I SAM-dependent methyltransferase [Candidatus Sumerlaeia bacterium]|nr:class I SAM-dependent methyltransferase [Candidatus Sumerlaeia bacterium]